MVLLNNHEKIVVGQRQKLGCIPSGYEWMIRFAKIEDVDLDNFQEDFDLQEKGLGNNSFIPIGDAIQKKYPQIKIEIKDFVYGQEKIEFIKNIILEQNPCLISVPNGYGDYHVMPVIGFNDDSKVFYFYDPATDSKKETEYKTILDMHSNNIGGHDIAWMIS